MNIKRISKAVPEVQQRVVTQIACMPNTNPVIDNGPLVSFIKTIAKERGVGKVHPIGAITKS